MRPEPTDGIQSSRTLALDESRAKIRRSLNRIDSLAASDAPEVLIRAEYVNLLGKVTVWLHEDTFGIHPLAVASVAEDEEDDDEEDDDDDDDIDIGDFDDDDDAA